MSTKSEATNTVIRAILPNANRRQIRYKKKHLVADGVPGAILEKIARDVDNGKFATEEFPGEDLYIKLQLIGYAIRYGYDTRNRMYTHIKVQEVVKWLQSLPEEEEESGQDYDKYQMVMDF